MARRKKHHTVTRALLKGFADKGDKLITRRRDGKEFPQGTVAASVVTDFYASKDRDSAGDPTEEWLASSVESQFAGLLPSLWVTGKTTVPMRPVIAGFVAAAVIRTRTARAYMEEIDKRYEPGVAREMFAEAMGWSLTDDWTDTQLEQAWAFYQQYRTTRSDPAASFLRTMVREQQRLRTMLKSYAWSVSSSAEPAFLIGDAPVGVLHDHAEEWHGLVPAGAVVFLPLSPYKVLVGEPHAFGSLARAGDRVVMVNALTVREAYDQVFRHPSTPWPAGLELGSHPPLLPRTSIHVAPAEPDPAGARSPGTYPTPDEASAQVLLQKLGAQDGAP